MRIAKYIANSGICSRRDAEEKIRDGVVKVNDITIDSPAINVDDDDKISVEGQVITLNKPRLWLYYKPVGLITTHKDPQNRLTIFESLPKTMPRVISVGRLDFNSEGLLLLTNSGEVACKFENPRSKITRCYKVKIFGYGPEINIKNKQLVIEGVRYNPKLITKIDQSSRSKNKLIHWYLVELEEGKNREIRKIFNHYGYKVVKLIRISFGRYNLGNLQPGEIKEVDIL
ncbi:MAG: rRNA pseudouridine synthase [Rickettsiaceae bacterium]|nr:rRNA pseudouridine synthase [Rickettsiaceae bacterium]